MYQTNRVLLVGDVTHPPKLNKAETGFWCGIRVYNSLLNFFVQMDTYVKSGLNLKLGDRVEAVGEFCNSSSISGNYIFIYEIRGASLKSDPKNIANIEGYFMLPFRKEYMQKGDSKTCYNSTLRHYKDRVFNDLNFKTFDKRVIEGYDVGDYYEIREGKIIFINQDRKLFVVPKYINQKDAGMIKPKKL